MSHISLLFLTLPLPLSYTPSTQESCPHKSVKYLPSYTCISDVTPLLETQCDDRVECVIHATNKNLGDPCRGIFKHLDIKFYCDAAQATTSSKGNVCAAHRFNRMILTL